MVGIAGLATPGHAGVSGAGAYAAGIFAFTAGPAPTTALSGFTMGPLLGRFAFDREGRTAAFYREGRTAAFYVLAVLVLALNVLRRLVASPFGLAVRSIHENRVRMAALGTPVFARARAGAVRRAAGSGPSAVAQHRRPGVALDVVDQPVQRLAGGVGVALGDGQRHFGVQARHLRHVRRLLVVQVPEAP